MKLLSRRDLVGSLTLTLFFLITLVAMEVSAGVAFVATLILIVQVAPGVVLMRVLHPAQPPVFTDGIGAAVGILASTFAHVIIRSITGTSVGFLLPAAACILMVAISAEVRKGLRHHSSASMGPQATALAEGIAPALLATIYLARDFRWFIPIGAVALVLLAAIHCRRKLLMIVVPLSASISWLAWTRRSEFWWFLTDDLEVFESISYHFLRFGAGDALGPLGELGARYHVLTYQWSGILAQVSGAQPYVILNRVLPVAIAMLTSILVWGFFSIHRTLSFGWRVTLSAVFPMFVNYSFVSPSYALGVALLVAAMWFWVALIQIKATYAFMLSFLFALGLALIKSSNIPVVVFGLAAVAIWKWREGHSPFVTASFNLFGAYFALAFYGATSLLNDRTTRQIDSFQMFGYAKQVLSELDVIAERPLRVFGAILVSAGLLLLPCLAGVWLWIRRRLEPVWALFALGVLPFAVVMTLISGNQANGYFVSSGLNPIHLVLLVSVGSLLSFGDTKRVIRAMLAVFLPAITTIFAMRLLVQRFNGGTTGEIWLRVVETSMLVPFAMTLLAAGPQLRRLSLPAPTGRDFVGIMVVAAFAVSASREVVLFQRLDKGPELTSADSNQALGTVEERDIIQQVVQLTAETAVLATNRFCGASCRGADWFDQDLDLLGEDFNLPSSASGFGGNNFRLSAESRRRVLLEGPRWLLVNGYSPEDARDRMSAALQFAETASENSRVKLEQFGVTHFVLHLPSRVSTIGLERYGEVVATNREFALIAL